MKKDDAYQELFNKAVRLLSIRPRSKKELEIRLQALINKKKMESKYLDRVIKELEELNLINDREFTRWWIESRKENRPKGKFAIIHELSEKGVSQEIIEDLVNVNYTKDEEEEIIQNLAVKRLSLVKEKKKEDKRRKIIAYLIRRGFDKETVFKVIDDILNKA